MASPQEFQQFVEMMGKFSPEECDRAWKDISDQFYMIEDRHLVALSYFNGTTVDNAEGAAVAAGLVLSDPYLFYLTSKLISTAMVEIASRCKRSAVVIEGDTNDE